MMQHFNGLWKKKIVLKSERTNEPVRSVGKTLGGARGCVYGQRGCAGAWARGCEGARPCGRATASVRAYPNFLTCSALSVQGSSCGVRGRGALLHHGCCQAA